MTTPVPNGLLGHLRETVPAFLQPVEFRVVETTDELCAASRLVYTEYLKRGYVCQNPTGLKFTIHQALPTTVTFIARHRRGGIIGTITLVQDSPMGLPMDEVYKAELDVLRTQGLRLAEATMLALNSNLFGRGVFTMFHAKKLLLTLQLFKVMFDYLRSSTRTDELVACFNPKHKILYDFLHLKPLGGLKAYTGANGNPAVARHLNIAATQREAKTAAPYRLFYGKPSSAKPFAKQLFCSAEELRQLFVLDTQLLACASPTELSHIKSCYPSYPFDEMLKHVISPPASHVELPKP